MAKSFGLAFREARKQGLKTFLWNGNWYGTALAGETKAASHGSVEKGKGQLAIAKRNGTNGLKYEVRKSNNGFYYIWDNDLQSQVGRTFKNAADALNYARSDDFKNNTSTVTITALRKKLDRNTPGYLPVDEVTDLTDRQGNTRVYKNILSGLHFVVDNYGNIVGDSFDPNAGRNGFRGWVINTGSKQDLQRAGAGELRATANKNEANLVSRQKELRQRLGEEGMIQDINNGRIAAGNVISQGLNLPFHAIWGLARTAAPNNNYSFDDYLYGFNMNQSNQPLNLTAGAGDIIADYMPEGSMRDFTQLGGNVAGNAALTSLAGRYTRSTPRKDLVGYEMRHLGNTGIVPKKGIPGQIRGNGQYIGKVTQKAGDNLWTTKKADPAFKVTFTGGNKSMPQAMYRTSNGKYAFYPKSSVAINPMYNSYRESATYAGSATPYHVVTGEPQSRSEYFDSPTANFTYTNGEGNSTVMGRITTGDFVPGTTGENWNGNIGGNSVTVSNTDNYVSPAFGGITAGSGKNNNSNLYLRGSYYKNGGRLKSRINGKSKS